MTDREKGSTVNAITRCINRLKRAADRDGWAPAEYELAVDEVTSRLEGLLEWLANGHAAGPSWKLSARGLAARADKRRANAEWKRLQKLTWDTVEFQSPDFMEMLCGRGVTAGFWTWVRTQQLGWLKENRPWPVPTFPSSSSPVHKSGGDRIALGGCACFAEPTAPGESGREAENG